MAAIPSFPEGQVEAVAKLLGDCGSGTDISRVLADRKLVDDSGESTKWRRLHWVFRESQRQHGCANQIVDFIQAFLIPSRFVGRSEEYESLRARLNVILSFSGLELGADGKCRVCNVAQTLDEAERRLNTLHSKFKGRQIHAEVLKYCRVELLQENYFHAVFEAAKGLAQRMRELSGVQADGAALVDRIFASTRCRPRRRSPNTKGSPCC